MASLEKAREIKSLLKLASIELGMAIGIGFDGSGGYTVEIRGRYLPGLRLEGEVDGVPVNYSWQSLMTAHGPIAELDIPNG